MEVEPHEVITTQPRRSVDVHEDVRTEGMPVSEPESTLEIATEVPEEVAVEPRRSTRERRPPDRYQAGYRSVDSSVPGTVVPHGNAIATLSNWWSACTGPWLSAREGPSSDESRSGW